tara:strand:- start:23670 stop:23978 length:309 start_codon:yes stop_codon:yes gene_type:complete
MKLLRNLLTVLLVLATIGVGVLFALQNKTPVPLDMLVYNFAPRSLALWVLLAFGIGGILGMLISSALMVKLRASLASVRRQLAKSREEVGRLQDQSTGIETQ